MLDLKQKYNRSGFISYLGNFLPEDNDVFPKSEVLPLDGTKHISSASVLSYSKSLGLKVFEVEHEGTQKARINLARETFRIMSDTLTNRALVVFKSSSDGQWRLSLMTIHLDYDESRNKIRKAFSNPRRYSYILGPNAKINTPTKYLISKGRIKDFEDLEKRFSVEVVNNDFYSEIASLYDELVGDNLESRALKFPGNTENSHQFAVRLIGRIVFCWFLREKQSAQGIPLINYEILSGKSAMQDNYYYNVLAPLFFEILNKPKAKRHERFQVGDFGQVPYLNGGLFSPLHDDYYKFENGISSSVPGLVDVPDSWLRKLFDLLELYHFTVDENTSIDVDLSIDPEMLGRIFENLLARINPETGETVRKSTGSFYTPREIVDYMVDTSLAEYITANTSIANDKIDALISYDTFDDIGNELSNDESISVLQALSSLTVLDPACGSGAYPIGMLQKIVFIITKLDPNAEWWLAKQLEGASPELRREFANKSVDYIRKLGVIRQTIFGVDIQPIATEISRLRCFLTLIVDEAVDDLQDNRGIRPLPNLEFKFVTANSLIGLPEQKFSNGSVQQDIFDSSQKEKIEKLRQFIDDYFSASSGDKSEIKAEYRYVQNQLWNDMHKSSAYGQQSLALTDWDPFDNLPSSWFDPEWMFGVSGGFNIVIGNPPYFQLQKNKKVGEELAVLDFITFSKSSDIYCIFYEKGIRLLSDNGVLTYITSNSWLKTKYGLLLRKYLTEKVNPLILVDFNDTRIFDSAVVESCILVLRKEAYSSSLRACSYNPKGSSESIREYFAESYVEIPKLDNNGWIIGSGESTSLRLKLESLSNPLKDYDQKIYIGLLNGFNDAYVIDTKTKDYLVEKDPNSSKIIKPMLRGRDVSMYGYKWSGLWMINPHNGIKNQLSRIDVVKDYPAIYEHLLKYKDKLEIRHNKGTHWTNLRNCAYFEEFDKPKIIWGELSDKPKFAYDEEGFIAEATLFAMVGKDLKFLLGILNSKLALWYFDQITTSSGMGTSRWKKYKIEQLPIRVVNTENNWIKQQIEDSVDKLLSLSDKVEINNAQNEIDDLVFKLYELDQSEINLVENRKSDGK